jgi:two-component system cell cycle response regulator
MVEELDNNWKRGTTPDEIDINTLEKKIYDLRNLIEIGMSLSSNLNFHSLVESLLYSCIGQMFVEKVAIILQVDIDINSYYIHMSKGYDQIFDKDHILLESNSPLVKYLIMNPLPQEFSALRDIKQLSVELEKLEILSPKLIVPMKSKNILNGFLILGAKINEGDFSNDEKEFLADLSKFAAIAVENSRLYLMATLDRMTRLYIHHYFQERLLEEIKRSQRYGTPLSLLMADIDHFKQLNDTYGHQQGDITLKELARLFKENLRKVDIAARYGGEEFAVILPDTDLKNAADVARRLRKNIEEYDFSGQTEPLHITISIGVAEYDINRDLDKDRFIKRADLAMYRAKRSGRNRVAVFR